VKGDRKMIDVAENPSEAVEKALDLFGDDILRLAYSYLKSRHDAEDIVQETLIRLMQKQPFFEDEKKEKSWLLTVASNLCKDLLRSAEKQRNVAFPEGFDIAREEQSPYDDEESILEAVMKMPEKYRSVIHLYYYEEYSTKEIADIVGKNESTIRSLLKRGREKLKRQWKGEHRHAEGI
jgi:RNA polymerase sigma-70 factor (ECF subfamily)